jgi:hypothetical protein
MKMCRKTKACLLTIEIALLLRLVRTSCCQTNAGFKLVGDTAGWASAPRIGSGMGDVGVASGASCPWGSWFSQVCMKMEVQH